MCYFCRTRVLELIVRRSPLCLEALWPRAEYFLVFSGPLRVFCEIMLIRPQCYFIFAEQGNMNATLHIASIAAAPHTIFMLWNARLVMFSLFSIDIIPDLKSLGFSSA